MAEWAGRFDVIWLMGVWEPSPKGERIAKAHRGLNEEIRAVLPDAKKADVVASPYAIKSYRVNSKLGGEAALGRFRNKLRRRGLHLMLDLVPNHMAPDHPWVTSHPGRFVQGTEEDLRQAPQNFFRARTRAGARIFAHGRDPYFDGWSDTVQINVFSPDARKAMIAQILGLTKLCDGLRCDMAMLLLNRIFKQTWGDRAGPEPATEFWADVISAVRARRKDFLFLAEVYWDLESDLQKLGFDFTYDKRLGDRLRDGHAAPIRAHLEAGPEFHARSAHFLENHDEPRAAAVFLGDRFRAAAVITYALPGIRFFYEGQLEGRQAKIPVQLRRRPHETPDPDVSEFYEKLIAALPTGAAWEQSWQMLESLQAWEENFSHERMFCFWWENGKDRRLAVANYAGDPSQCRVRLPLPEGPTTIRFRDLLSDRTYDRDAGDVRSNGLYLDLGGYDVHLFALTQQP
ncbi:alpha-amylase [bacterium]|nr:alpha-amylase [bacterium]